MFHYRQALHQMQQGASDRAIAKTGLMGRHKHAELRSRAQTEGWLLPGAVIPDDATLDESQAMLSAEAVVFGRYAGQDQVTGKEEVRESSSILPNAIMYI